MAEVIRPKFDVVRGWAGGTLPGTAYDRHFDKVVDGSGAPAKIKQGTFVKVGAAGVTPVTSADNEKVGDYAVFCIVEGNDPADSYSGDYLDKVVGIKGDYEVLLSETLFVAGSYTVGAPVCFDAGKVTLQGGVKPKMGIVMAYDAAAKLLQVSFNL